MLDPSFSPIHDGIKVKILEVTFSKSHFRFLGKSLNFLQYYLLLISATFFLIAFQYDALLFHELLSFEVKSYLDLFSVFLTSENLLSVQHNFYSYLFT